MKSASSSSFVTAILAGLTILATPAQAQLRDVPQEVAFAERNLGGPRLGVTYVMGGGNGELLNKLRGKGIGSVISQFGWHFEYQIIPEGGGPQFVIQGIPFLGAVEYGTVVPSLTVAMGVRLPDGFEFGLGPNVIIGGTKGANTSLVAAVGKSFNYGGVSIPINLAFATSPTGNRLSVIFGYAIAGATK
ncbi:MAG: hypothetical protein A2X66_07385 [Ignavibacteria bacterium GWA2_54_16]|nr:MAG: hypothetical protein A2X66_07385 [Ignavibacteria bacterium GWA2_54_16]